MKKNLFSLVFIFILLSSIKAQNIDSEKLFEIAKKGITLIKVEGIGQGSGFLVNDNGYIITNYHVIEGAEYQPNRIKVIFENNEQHYVTNVLDYDKEIDLALLKISKVSTQQSLPILAEKEAKQGSDVATIGNPLGQGFTITAGIISNTNPKNAPNYVLQTNVAINSGNSGGALLNKNGQVVGVIVAKLVGTSIEGFGFAIKVNYLRAMLNKNNVPYQTLPLITDMALKEARQMTDEEKEAEKQKELTRLRAERQKEEEKGLLESEKQKEIYKQQAETAKMEAERKRQIREAELEDERKRINESAAYRKIERDKQNLYIQTQKEQQRKERKERRMLLPNRISLKFGVGINNYTNNVFNMNAITPNLLPTNYENLAIMPIGQAMLAYRFSIDKNGKKERGHSLGFFGSYGFIDKATIQNVILTNISPSISTPELQMQHSFYEIEAGGLIREWFRLSGGIGTQNFEYKSGIIAKQYYTTTMGFVIRFGMVEFDLNFTGLFGGFYQAPSIRTNFTLNLHLKAIK